MTLLEWRNNRVVGRAKYDVFGVEITCSNDGDMRMRQKNGVYFGSVEARLRAIVEGEPLKCLISTPTALASMAEMAFRV